ncbi:hypothetical protein CDEST_03096 [Colletotrichum destructivum]|uniref:Uncharacterized protein n=1 Tax=Colletotrichum destructivum TaxID=34406 RepID=A0AAX4I449_9PEZI|nr:hypothetical protein CDEST_03096 [Colletotrichum destructivum]
MYAAHVLLLASLAAASVMVRDTTQSNNSPVTPPDNVGPPKQGNANTGLNPDYTYVVFKRDAEAASGDDVSDVKY